MLFFDYTFRTAYDGSIILDEELKAESLGVVEGDTFVVRIVNNQIILEKKQHGPS
jgi:hypothetical protein